jgi:hypothetical protein
MGDATRIGLYKEHYLDGPPLYDPKCSHFAAFTSVFKQSEPGKTERSFARPPRKAQSKVCAFAQTAALGLCTLRLIHQSDKTGGSVSRALWRPDEATESRPIASRASGPVLGHSTKRSFSTRRHGRVALSEQTANWGRRLDVLAPTTCEMRSQRSNPPLGLF